MSAKHISISVPCILQVLIITVANRPVKVVYTHDFYFMLSEPARSWEDNRADSRPCLVSNLSLSTTYS